VTVSAGHVAQKLAQYVHQRLGGNNRFMPRVWAYYKTILYASLGVTAMCAAVYGFGSLVLADVVAMSLIVYFIVVIVNSMGHKGHIRRLLLDKRAKFDNVLKWVRQCVNFRSLVDEFKKSETFGEKIKADTSRLLNSQNSLGNIIFQELLENTIILIFEQSGLGDRALGKFGLKDLNDILGYELNNKLIERKKEIIRGVLLELGIVDKEGVSGKALFSTFKQSFARISDTSKISQAHELISERIGNILMMPHETQETIRKIFGDDVPSTIVARIIEDTTINAENYAEQLGLEGMDDAELKKRVYTLIEGHKEVIFQARHYKKDDAIIAEKFLEKTSDVTDKTQFRIEWGLSTVSDRVGDETLSDREKQQLQIEAVMNVQAAIVLKDVHEFSDEEYEKSIKDWARLRNGIKAKHPDVFSAGDAFTLNEDIANHLLR